MQQGLIAEVKFSIPKEEEVKIAESERDEYSGRGANVLILECVGNLGNIAFLLCAAVEDYWHMEDATDIKSGELIVIPSNWLSLVKAKPVENNKRGLDLLR